MWYNNRRRTIKFDSDSFYLSTCWYDSWFKKDRWHRLNGPAIIEYYDNGQISVVCWYYQGSCRRSDGGPIEIVYDKDGNEIEVLFTHF